MVSHRPFQSLHPLSLLAQLISRHASGCLNVTSGSTTWVIYLDEGKLTYASSSTDPFERLDRHLRQLSRQVPGLVSAVRVQVRLLFETSAENCLATSADHQAIRWLVGQQYLNVPQATLLIEELAKEVIENFLAINEGSYEIVEKREFEDYPHLCQLDLRPIVEHCQTQLRRRQTGKTPLTQRPDLLGSRSTPQPESASYKAPSDYSATTTNSKEFRRTPAEPSAKHRYTIACIDDSPTILQAINAFLDDTSFAVLMINDPVKALMQVVRSKPDLILLDVGMPNLDGYELCSLLRRHPNFKHTPIIMVTGHTGFIDRAKAKLAGASGYLTKPFTQSELLKMVFKHLT